ncbi:hypothetical protein PCH_Pc22g15000 [Penicillium rubens Wisconsin 54-1255]|uniref:Uncharacterized protein n=1 Tax=Penicillium rubens (strain ATCC 28089 / DSM 1075 / NRRL 1951 / Wisconsin 54-1255) TaxID=500485 RepID=B6HVL9_PENRW|nr:hypothetical protein PCH_Pc22g15000 [Penicillium rubens Wisconsin 54-1255]
MACVGLAVGKVESAAGQVVWPRYDGSVFPGRLARRMSGKTSPAANCWCPRIAGPFFWSLHLFYFCLCGWSCLVLDDPWLVLLCLVSGCAPCFVLFCLAVPRFCLVPSSGPLAPQGLFTAGVREACVLRWIIQRKDIERPVWRWPVMTLERGLEGVYVAQETPAEKLSTVQTG